MPRKKRTEQDGMLQPVLFTPDAMPERHDLVELVKRGFDHTGRNLMKDELLCSEVMSALIRGVSGRMIARTYQVSRNSIAGIRQEMERRGLVEPLKKQIAGLLGNIITMGLEDFQEALAQGRLHPSQLPVPLGIFMTHKALVDGDPTVRVDTGKPSELSVESVRRHFEALKRATVTDVKTVTLEAESTVPEAKPQ